MAKKNGNGEQNKSLESWIWSAACSIRGAQDAPKYKDFILPLIFTKRLCDVYEDEIDRIAKEVGSREKAFKWVAKDKKLVRFYIPFTPEDTEKPVWSVIRLLSDKIGESLTSKLIEIAKENPKLDGIINRIDYNATTHGSRDIDDDRLSSLIEAISNKRLGLKDVEPDIIGRSYEYLIRKFAEGSGQSAGEFYTPTEVGILMAKLMNPEPGQEIYDPNCGSGGLLIKCEIELERRMSLMSRNNYAPLILHGQEYTPATFAMAWMNMIIHDMDGKIEIGDSMKNPKFKTNTTVQKFDRILANPMWNQGRDNLPYMSDSYFIDDEFERFPAGSPGGNADWAWTQLILSGLKENGKAAIVLDTGAATRGSGNENTSKERNIRRYFVENNYIDAVLLMPENIFYNTQNASIIIILNKNKTQDDVMMIDITEFYDKSRPKNYLSKEGQDLAIEAYEEWKNIINVSTITTKETIIENDYVLLPSRYVNHELNYNYEQDIQGDFTHKRELFKDILISNYFSTYFLDSKTKNEYKLDFEIPNHSSEWIYKTLDEVLDASELTHSGYEGDDEIVVLSLTKNDGLIPQSNRFGHSVAIEDTSKYKIVKKGWVVYNPMVIWEGAIHVLKNSEIGIVSPAYKVWIPKEGIDYRFLDYMLRTPKIMDYYRRLASGGVKRRRIVSEDDFKSIEIPVPNKTLMKKFTDTLETILNEFDGALNKIKF